MRKKISPFIHKRTFPLFSLSLFLFCPELQKKKYPPCGKYLQEMKLLKYISENNEIYQRCFIMIKINRVTHLKEWNHH